MLFCAPLKGNPPLSRHSLILATQAGPWRALSDLIHCSVCSSVCMCVCVCVCVCVCAHRLKCAACAHFTMFYKTDRTCYSLSSRQQPQRMFEFFLAFLLSFLFGVVSYRWIINEIGNCRPTSGLPQPLTWKRGARARKVSEGRQAWNAKNFLVWNSAAIKEFVSSVAFHSFFLSVLVYVCVCWQACVCVCVDSYFHLNILHFSHSSLPRQKPNQRSSFHSSSLSASLRSPGRAASG